MSDGHNTHTETSWHDYLIHDLKMSQISKLAPSKGKTLIYLLFFQQSNRGNREILLWKKEEERKELQRQK